MWAIRQLLVPCNYLRIHHGGSFFASKAVYDWVFPFALTTITIVICIFIKIPLVISGKSSIFSDLSSLLALLIAFYMAALAAVSTFGRVDIDQNLRGGDATLKVLNHETKMREPKSLSYRQFISYLFGYLSFLSLVLFVALMSFKALWPKIVNFSSEYVFWDLFVGRLEPILFSAFVFGFWQMLVSSLLGIYFLTDRIHTINEKHH